MNDSLFLAAYNRLNAEQKKAVDTIEGPVMVIAGPGTGKTQILTLRIANILRVTDASPESILALTFTESGARAMRERLASYIGAPAYRVPIHTFHEFAGRLIRSYPDAYERAVGGRPIADLEKISLIESILSTPTITLLRPRGNPQFYISPIMNALSHMKREYITPDSFARIIEEQEAVLNATPKIHEKGAHKGKVRSEYIDREKGVAKNRELLFVYRAYEAALAEQRLVDFDDMIFETVKVLEHNEDMLRSLQEQYQYVLADEHQDVNGSQNRILELLASFHDRPNLFVVGDEKQSIYRFQGASLENFLFFEEKFPHTTTVALTSNYRSAQGILDLAQELITAEEGPASMLRVALTASRGEIAQIESRSFSHEAVEYAYIVDMVEKLIAEKVPADEVAIIMRTNREVEEIATLLRKKGVHAESSADSDILTHPITAHVRILLRAITNPSDERALFELLHSGYSGICTPDLVRITQHRSYSNPLARIVADADFLESIGVENITPIMRMVKLLADARNRMGVEAPHRLLEFILKESGFFDHAVAHDPFEGSRVIRRLYDEVEVLVQQGKVSTLKDVEEMFAQCVLHNIALNAPYIHTGSSAVQVMTAHKAKGLEFLHVFVPHLTDNKWGGRARAEYFAIPVTKQIQSDDIDPLEDERKLLYVALTRAKVGLYLSMSATNIEGRTLLPTRLLEGVGVTLITRPDTREYEDSFNPGDTITLEVPKETIDTALLSHTIRTRGLSATALNNYLRSPWDYLYRNVLHIPEVQAGTAQFGTALHGALESVFRYRHHEGSLPDATTIKSYLERELGKLPITNDEYVRHHEAGFAVLLSYLDFIKDTLPHETKEEYKLQVVLETGNTELPQIPLTGMFDRLDFGADGILMRVVDYKTGKPRTRGYIEGTTKDSNGDYKRQLTFYALILALSGDDRLASRTGTLSFIEPDEKGVIHEETYVITEEEIEALKTEIIRVGLEIAHGAFLNAPCDPAISSYCHLVTELNSR